MEDDQLTVDSLPRRRAPRTSRGALRRGVPQVTTSVLRLGPLEAAIMDVMWQADDWLTTREIQDRIDYPTRAEPRPGGDLAPRRRRLPGSKRR